MKVCSQCKIGKQFCEFNKCCTTKDGLQIYCKTCRKENREKSKSVIKAQKDRYYKENKERLLQESKEDRKANPEKYKEQERRKYLKHRERIIKSVSDYYKKKPEVNRKSSKKYRDNNPEKSAEKAALRRSAKLKATPKWVDNEWDKFLFKEIFHLSKLRKHYLDIPFHVDHIVPLKSEIVCGLHCPSNLRVIEGEENLKKSNKFWPDMW